MHWKNKDKNMQMVINIEFIYLLVFIYFFIDIMIYFFHHIHLSLIVLVCSDGTHISSGICVRCLGRCKGGAPCNKSTGRCDHECEDNWTGQFCEGTS